MGRIIYVVLAGSLLVLWIGAGSFGWTGGGKSYKLPPSMRQSPGGYRTFAFWHAGYQAGK